MKLLRGEALYKRAEELGVSIWDYHQGKQVKAQESIVQRRVQEAEQFKERLFADEIRFVKEQQYRTIYYSLLLFAAVIGIFQIRVSIEPYWLYIVLKLAAILIIGFFAWLSLSIQWDHFKALNRYREELKDWNAEVAERTKKQGYKYQIGFWVLTVFGAISTGIVIYFDS